MCLAAGSALRGFHVWVWPRWTFVINGFWVALIRLLKSHHHQYTWRPLIAHQGMTDRSKWKDYSITYTVQTPCNLIVKTKYEIKPNSHHNEIVCMCVYTRFVESIEVVDFMMFIMKKQPTVFTSSCEWFSDKSHRSHTRSRLSFHRTVTTLQGWIVLAAAGSYNMVLRVV